MRSSQMIPVSRCLSATCILVLIVACVVHAGTVGLAHLLSQPQISSATYEEKEISLLGRDFTYGVYEINFNEEISVLDNMPCPCYGQSQQLCNVTQLPYIVDETGYEITALSENIPISVSMDAGSNRVFKINLQPKANVPCPILVIQLTNEQGPVDMYVSNREIPSQGKQMWTKPYWGRDSVWLCPTLNWFGYGNYYITAVSQIGDATNRYNISYTIKQAPQCPARVAPTVPEPADGSWQWVQDGQAIFGNVSQDEYYFFRYQVPTRCANISASGRRQQFESADIDIYASLTNTQPTLENYDWNANMDGDDSLVMSVCASQAPFTIYFSVTTYLNRSPYAFTVTHTSNFEMRPVTSVGAHSISWLLARGADLDCGSTVFECHFGPYPQCYGDGFRCCFPFYFLAPTANPNPIWPRNGYDPVTKEIMADMKFGAYNALLPKKLAFGIQIAHRTSEGDYTRYVDPSIDLSKCTLRWRNLLVSSTTSEALTTPVSFSPKQRACDSSEFTATKNQVYSYIDSMYNVESQDQLTLSHLKLAFTAFSSSFTGCTSLIDSLTTPARTVFQYDDLTNCNSLWGTPAYDESPCCSSDLAFSQCCAPYSLNHTVTIPAQSSVNAIQQRCRAPECSTQVVNSYVRLLQKTGDLQSGCSAVFRSVAGSKIIENKIRFIRECRESILGDDLLGRTCSSNADCLPGSSCLSNGHCDHTEAQVIDCFAEKIDPVVGTFLLRRWGVSGAFSTAQLIQEMNNRIFNDTCVGGNAIRYRDHYWYQRTTPFCSDECSTLDAEPRCLEPSCSVPDICDRSITGNSCWRFWSFNRADSAGCVTDRYCSWIDCAAAYPGDTAVCQAACLDPLTVADSVCVRCENPFSCSTAAPYDSFDQTRCSAGLCSADETEISASACAAKGTCTARCRDANGTIVACSSSATCTAAGVCTDADTVGTAIANLIGAGDSICILPFSFESGVGAACANASNIQVPSGCATDQFASRAECVSAGGYWHTLATSSANCAALGGSACFDSESGAFLNRSRAECEKCSSSSEWRSPYSWSQGVWTPGRVIPLQWVAREWKQTNRIARAINYPRFTEEVQKAIAEDVSTAFLTEALCRFDNLVKTIGAVACDCGSSSDTTGSCFSAGAGTRQIGVGRVCPSLDNFISVAPVTISAAPTALSTDESCKVIRISLTPNDQFALSGLSSLTSEIFKQRITNVYAVARNSLGAIVGQILSDGIGIQYDGSTSIPMTVCISTVESIPREAAYAQYDLAMLDATNNKIVVLDAVANATGSAVCAQVIKNGTFFAVAKLPEWRSVVPYDAAQRAQSFVGAALYYFVVAFGLAQTFILSMWDRRNMFHRLALVAVVTSFNLIRGAYLTLAPGTLDQSPGARYIFFELPTFLFFSAYSVVLYLWTLVIQRSQKMGNQKAADRNARMLLVILNIVFYVVFIVFVILFATLGTASSPCSFSEAQAQSILSNNQRNLGIAYQAIISLICMVLAAIFCIQGLRLVMLLRKFRQNENKARSVRRMLLTVTAAVCTISFIIRSAVFIAASAGGSLPVIVFVLLEVIPSTIVLWIMNPWNSSLSQYSSKTMSSSRQHSTNSRVTRTAKQSLAPVWGATTTSGSTNTSGRDATTNDDDDGADSTEELSDTGESI